MQDRADSKSASVDVTSQWYQTAFSTAVIGTVFSVIVLALTAFNYFHRAVVLPKQEEQLDALKLQLHNEPENQKLTSRIREFDLEIRRSRIRTLDFSRKGSYLLLASVTVLLIGAKWAGTLRKKKPAPQLRWDMQDEQAHQAKCARWAVTASLVIFGSTALFFWLRPAIDFSLPGSGARVGAAGSLYPSVEEISKNWPRFRGPGGLGISAYTNVPAGWNGKTGQGIIWKSEVPLPGHNSPVVWDDRVFVSGATENTRQVYCFNALAGELLWRGDVVTPAQASSEPVEVAKDTGFAAPTMVTDGRRVYAIFANGDVGCFDFHGKQVWARNLGTPDSAYGYASSLAMYRNLVLVQYDQASVEDDKSKLIALDVFSGRTVWQTKRPVGSSWTSPIVAQVGSQAQMITCANPWVIAYDAISGAEIWRAKCLAGDVAPSPIYAGGLVFAIEPYNKFVAIRPDGHGDVTQTHIAWTVEDIAPDICSPVSNGEMIFLLTSDGLLACYKVADGTKLWESDLRENFKASQSLVGDRLYLLSEQGITFIAEVGSEYKELARCELGEDCHASPAFADGRIYIRGLKNLYCIGTTIDR
jgi:outer membrane protein assembly factor BamB